MSDDRPIIKKVIKVSGGGHHGGAWKVAYADFVTAMMAFFLLMWLINTTTPEQKRGVADYFAPASISESRSGAGGILGGTALGEDGARNSGTTALVSKLAPKAPKTPDSKKGKSRKNNSSSSDVSENALQQALARREDMAFKEASESLRQAMQDMPELAELSKNLMVDQTPEGLRIQIVDQEGRSMFEPGSADLKPHTIVLLRSVAKIINRLPNRISIYGHTDASPSAARGYSNWDLSFNRANAARQILQESQVPEDRFYQVTGKAGSEPLFPDDPYMPGNRRISIVLLREAPPLPPGHKL
ncbi:MAG: flagellar motor protein MotB [Robiginitomaculum sp.]|nr:flagellar motor protein MotB [Robiginitomaculum sp.]MDQ7078349.1 flagellar motor protein MotB [Robiginitomaculum sp.]